MVVHKRKKVTKYRAHTTHGGGHRKKRRGAGNRGGRGRAGSGKKGKAKKPSFGKLGGYGFLPKGTRKKIKIINISDLDKLIQKKKMVTSQPVDLSSLGYQKLLSAGKTNLKLKIKVNQFSRQAEEKVKAAGGSIVSEKKNKTEVLRNGASGTPEAKPLSEKKVKETEE